MSPAELVILSVKVEGRSKSEVARDYRISRYWVHQLVRRYETEGEAAYEPRSRRPHSNPRAVDAEIEERILRLRKELSRKGWDAGADTIRSHLQRDPTLTRIPAVSTIWRILVRRGFVVPQPHKRPKSAGHRFEAAMPNERWQSDTTHWQLADGTPVEILNIEDDHSRLDLASEARYTTGGNDVVTSFRRAFRRYGIPARVLTELQRQLDRFRRYNNNIRPHRGIGRRTPAEAYAARPKAAPADPRLNPHYRVRRDRSDGLGVVTCATTHACVTSASAANTPAAECSC